MFSELLLCLKFLKNNKPKIILLSKRHYLRVAYSGTICTAARRCGDRDAQGPRGEGARPSAGLRSPLPRQGGASPALHAPPRMPGFGPPAPTFRQVPVPGIARGRRPGGGIQPARRSLTRVDVGGGSQLSLAGAREVSQGRATRPRGQEGTGPGRAGRGGAWPGGAGPGGRQGVRIGWRRSARADQRTPLPASPPRTPPSRVAAPARPAPPASARGRAGAWLRLAAGGGCVLFLPAARFRFPS